MAIRAYKFRIYPTEAQEQTLRAWQEICHEIQRLLVLQRRIAEDRQAIQVWGGKKGDKEFWNRRSFARFARPSWSSQSKEVTQLLTACPELKSCPRDLIEAIVKRVDDAFKRRDKERKKGRFIRPRWADKSEQIGLQFRGANRGTILVSHEGRFAYWRLSSAGRLLGSLKVRMHRHFVEGAELKQVQITLQADGWYASFVCEEPDAPARPAAPIAVAAYNLGCRHDGERQRVAMSDAGKEYQIDDTEVAQRQRKRTLERLVSPRKVRGAAKAADPKSKRTAKRRERLARIEQRETRQRQHQQQFVARRIVDSSNVILVEDTDYAAMRQREAREEREARGASRRIERLTNRSMASASPGRLRALIALKATQDGRELVLVPSSDISQTCSRCGHVQDPPITLSQVRWTCSACDERHDRDQNAARNIRKRAGR